MSQNEILRIRDDWRVLRQADGKLKEYITKYWQIMLQIKSMDEVDRLHGFLYGLQLWVRRELVLPKSRIPRVSRTFVFWLFYQ